MPWRHPVLDPGQSVPASDCGQGRYAGDQDPPAAAWPRTDDPTLRIRALTVTWHLSAGGQVIAHGSTRHQEDRDAVSANPAVRPAWSGGNGQDSGPPERFLPAAHLAVRSLCALHPECFHAPAARR